MREVLKCGKGDVSKYMLYHPSRKLPADSLGALLKDLPQYCRAAFFSVFVGASIIILELQPFAPVEMTSLTVLFQYKLFTSHVFSVLFLICG